MSVTKKKLLLVAGLAFLTRIFFVLVFPQPAYYKGISDGYVQAAGNILEGRGAVLLADVGTLSGPPTSAYVSFIDRPLGYVVLILLPSLISSHMPSVQIVQAILSACSAVFLFHIGCLLFSEIAAFRASLFYALWPVNARLETLIIPDAVMSFFLLLGLWFFLQAFEQKKSILFFLYAGFVFGAGMLMRPDISLLPFFLILLMFAVRRPLKKLLPSILLTAGILVVILPHTIRNYSVTGGKIIPFGLGSGISLWEGISQFGDTLGTVYGDDRMTAREGYRSWAYPDGVERDRQRFREAVDIILDHPVWYLGVMARRVPVLLKPDGILVGEFLPPPGKFFKEHPVATLWEYGALSPVAVAVQVALILTQLVALLLAAITLIKNLSNRVIWFPAGVIFYYIMIHIPTNTEARYFYPVIPIVLLFAVQAREYIIRRT